MAQQPAQPAATAAPTDSNYVGAETCKGCHEDQFNKFAKMRMGRLFLQQARTPGEANACESCHGPGKAHVDAGRGKGKGGLITFAKNDKTPAEQWNAVWPTCHTKGARIFCSGVHNPVAGEALVRAAREKAEQAHARAAER